MFEWLFKRSKKEQQREANASTAPVVRSYGSAITYVLGGTSSDLAVSTVYRCVDLLAKSVANLPMQVQRKQNGLFVNDDENRLAYLLNVQPNEWQSAFDFWRGVVQSILLEGNAYIVPMYVGTDIARLVHCSPHSVSHDIYDDTYTVTDNVNGLFGTYDANEILHLKNISLNGRNGMSVIEYARTTMATASQGDAETLTRFANGGNVRGIISNDTDSVRGFGEYQDNQLQDLAKQIDQNINIDGNRIVGMAGQVKFQQMSLSSTDMQFLETRKFTVREICRFFGVHPSFVFDDTSNNYKSAEMANVAFLSNTLNPILRMIENELLRKLVAPSLAMKRRFVFDREGLYVCDLSSRVSYQQNTIAAGLMTVNEWRKKENKMPVEGGDKILVSANLKGIQELTQENTDNGTEE